MKYTSACSKTCLLLSSLLATSATGRDSGRISLHHTTNSQNDYIDSMVRRLQTTGDDDIVTDRRARTKSCAIEDNCESTYYYYKDFENGVTFAQAHSAIGTEADLHGCVLAPIYSHSDLVEISQAIPPCKAAFTAAYKDPLRVYREARACILNGFLPYNCDYQPLGTTLSYFWDGADVGSFGVCSLEEWFGDDFTGGETWCPALKEDGWVNFGSTESIPSSAWRDGDSSYCGEGPIQNAAAAFAMDYGAQATITGEPNVFLKSLNSGEYLPGAVYKCCDQNVLACFTEEK
eukprot:CAMPEP_0116119002 /NCGR_PEP_ID=MMETSP0329-20121206/2408_1 /TAXON_ID=697910 /ORGANISM="Pseudo-nitzschia arenysensis, Strain B593" /LENGTH=289 /DNA_ID=CAMNT_0003612673 /DNA_START=22 /DNA_END=891 /DNA_ORIENTATION=-